MTTEKDDFVEGDEELRESQYNEDAFNALVENDDESSADEELELSDFAEGAEESDGKPDTASNEQPEGEDKSGEDKDSDTDKDESQDDPQQSEDDGPELPAWMEAIPEDQKDNAVTDFLKLHQDNIKLKARYESQSGQLKPTQRRLARLEERIKLTSEIKPGDDLEERAGKIEAWIEKHGEDFPDEASGLQATFDAYKEAVTTVAGDAEKHRSTLDDDTDDDNVDRSKERKLLERMDASSAEINADPAFVTYLQQHPEHAAQARSPFAHDVIEVIDHFRTDTDWQPPMQSEEFQNINQMVASPLFTGWSRAIGLTAEHVGKLDQTGQAKVFNQFKEDLDAAHQGDDGSDDDGESGEAARLQAQRNKRKKNISPAARRTGTGGGKPSAVKGEAYFDTLEV